MFQPRRVSSPVPFIPGRPWGAYHQHTGSKSSSDKHFIKSDPLPAKPEPTSAQVVNMANPPVTSGNAGTNRKKLLIAQFLYENPDLDLQGEDNNDCCKPHEKEIDDVVDSPGDVRSEDYDESEDDMPPLEGESACGYAPVSPANLADQTVHDESLEPAYDGNLDNPQPLKYTKSPLAVLDNRNRQVQSVAPFLQTIPSIGDDLLSIRNTEVEERPPASLPLASAYMASKPEVTGLHTSITASSRIQTTTTGGSLQTTSTTNSGWFSSSFYQQYEYFSQTCNQFSAMAEKTVKPKDIKSLLTMKPCDDDPTPVLTAVTYNATQNRQHNDSLPISLISSNDVNDSYSTQRGQSQPQTTSWHPMTGYSIDRAAPLPSATLRSREFSRPDTSPTMQLNLAVGGPVTKEHKTKNSGGYY